MARENPYYREMLYELNKKYPDKECLNAGELAKYLGVSHHTALDLIHSRKIPALVSKNSGKSKSIIRVPKTSLAMYLTQLTSQCM